MFEEEEEEDDEGGGKIFFLLCDNCLDSRQSSQGYRLNHAFQVFFMNMVTKC